MVIIGITGKPGSINRNLLLYAVNNSPSLFIDCANCANPHSLFPLIDIDSLGGVYVMQAELIYTFRDVLKKAAVVAQSLKVNCIIITTFNGLFDYDDKLENKDVYAHCWELIKELSKTREVLVGLSEGSQAEHCDQIVRSQWSESAILQQKRRNLIEQD
ncbi:MAG: hypothetical protein ABIF10_05345 [Candidatus Woesearchaeota archaeon]